MVDFINTVPDDVRGGGFLLEQRLVSDFVKSDCDIIVHNESINDVTVPVFRISTGSSSDGYSAVELMELIDNTLVKDIVFANNQIRYTSISAEDVTSVNDLNGVVTGISYSNGSILFDTFESSNALLYENDLEVLAGALTSITYDSSNFKIKYDTVGEISE